MQGACRLLSPSPDRPIRQGVLTGRFQMRLFYLKQKLTHTKQLFRTTPKKAGDHSARMPPAPAQGSALNKEKQMGHWDII